MKKNMDDPNIHLTCKHSACNCSVSENEEFCSNKCRQTAEPDVCPCEHEHCNEEKEETQEYAYAG